MGQAAPPTSTVSYDAEYAKRVIPGMVDRYITMADFANRHGAGLVIAVQPDIYTTGKVLTEEEESVNARYTERFQNIEEAYPKFRADYLEYLQGRVTGDNALVVDLSRVFDTVSEPLFLDNCHFNDRGYQKIASLLADKIRGRYLNP